MTIQEVLKIYTSAVQEYGQALAATPEPEQAINATAQLYAMSRRARISAENLARLSAGHGDAVVAWQAQAIYWEDVQKRWEVLRGTPVR